MIIETAQFIRRHLRHSAQSIGYVVDGNHLFSSADYCSVLEGRHRLSVSECPRRHSAKAQRIANALSATYCQL